MAWLPLILFAPAFALLAWLYWAFPRSLPGGWLRRLFDLGALALAVALTAQSVAVAFARSAGDSGLWPQVLATTVAFHVYPLVLGLAWLLRSRLPWRRPPG